MYSRHEEFTGTVNATMERAFEHLDDQLRLSAHMQKRSWKMGWGKMDLHLDDERGRAVGSRIILEGRVFGIHLYLDEVVTERVPPTRKRWETVGDPRLLVIGAYTMGFDLAPRGAAASVRVSIDYDFPRRGWSSVLARLFGRSYAQWCTKKMVRDAQAAFPS
jgi:hypothetical protein